MVSEPQIQSNHFDVVYIQNPDMDPTCHKGVDLDLELDPPLVPTVYFAADSGPYPDPTFSFFDADSGSNTPPPQLSGQGKWGGDVHYAGIYKTTSCFGFCLLCLFQGFYNRNSTGIVVYDVARIIEKLSLGAKDKCRR
jgi:hypothetical protein